MSNPLLDQAGLPAFARILPEHVEPALDARLAACRAEIARLTGAPGVPTWESFVEPLEESDDTLSRTWSPVGHLNAVMNSEALRAAYNACLPKLSDYGTEVGQNEDLFRAYQAVAAQEHLDATQRKLLDNALRDFHLSGVDLPADRKARYKAISQELSQLTAKYSENLLDATNAWSKLVTDPSRLAGLPESALGLARQSAQQRGQDGWLLTLDMPSYIPVMTYADDRDLRFEVYQAFGTRASDQGPHAGQWDNGDLMERILALRHELAQLLGFANYAERSLATKMARSPDQVLAFLNDLAQRSVTQARGELEEVRAFALEHHGQGQLEPWDLGYYSEKLRVHRYQISQEELRPYFPVSRVLSGLFGVAQRLFGVDIEEAQGFETYHPQVRFFEIRDTETRQLRGQFYLDPFARPDKRGGAWMDVCTNRLHTARYDQIPVAYLVCNFSPPVGDQPSLLTHNEVETLFHEFGHGLHHLLTRVDYPAVAGINGVAWDAVELPSQFMENWCWEREPLDLFAAHWQTGERLPEDLYGRMTAARNFQSAMQMVRQLEFALFDFRLHLEYDPARGGRIYEILEEVRDQVAVIRPPAFNRFAHSFSHVFAGGYAAGYYSYKWAEVLSADAFSLFEERGVFDAATGRAFKESILEQGGSRDAMVLYVDFRGREPTTDALLRHSGIAA
ncbi:oligopeptidase A [Candidatus Thiodictyon syntrophicum]|jgi:oligopeptidase A|uniref:oligopeptidase A n=1 Tax=Candidatus Thiodictyon syntrophicum TaxID=1166950 RepID=A0A2K8U7T9_9GAMM|nr:oligopeptidase A [Candidatus Thiodictyon syntrophicum]AUB81469.1 oligopeptidase A [Candidatus Thiodictyon syntrophicum]